MATESKIIRNRPAWAWRLAGSTKSGLTCLLLLLSLLAKVNAQTAGKPVSDRDSLRPGVHHRRVPVPTALTSQLAMSVDAGDSYAGREGRRYLRRLPGAVAVKSLDQGNAARERAISSLTRAAGPLPGYREATRLRSGLVVLRADAASAIQARSATVAAKDPRMTLERARHQTSRVTVNPVFVDPQTGLQLLIDGRLIVRLRSGVDPARHFGRQWSHVHPLWGTDDQFVVSVPGGTAEDVLAEVDRQAALPEVIWAEPDFLGQAVRSSIPNDPYFGDQWHLENVGQTGAMPGADAHLTGAWDYTTGRSNIVIAILDDGVQLNHPDLSPNLYRNDREIAGNGFDDDRNGVIDDVSGYNFVADLDDPNPYSIDDNHGTAVAGLAAAVGNNGLGTVGVAPGCRILPVKILEGDFAASASQLAKALRYAAGLGSSGQSVWAGADVLNISLVFGQLASTDAALADVVSKGRNGRGCAVMVAAGNYASAWEPVEYIVEEAGTYTLRFEYSKDSTDGLSIGADTVWIDSIRFPDGTVETFEGDLSDAWSTSTFSPWSIVTDGVAGNFALTGWNGPGSHALRAGRITHNQTNYAEMTTTLTPGRLVVWTLVSSELDYDYFDFWVGHNGTDTLIFTQSGVPLPEPLVSYPGSNPNTIAIGASTDFDYRADYSQYGSLLDFVVPSDGGLGAITTTDRTGTNGYGPDDYTFQFGGTSASAPIGSGAGALVLSLNPYITAGELRTLLRGTCDRIGEVNYDANGRNTFYGSGRINVARALAQSRPNLRLTLSAPPGPVLVGDVMTYSITVRNTGFSRSGLIVLTNPLPVGTVFVSSTPATINRSGGRLMFNGASLPAGSNWIINVTVSNTTAGTKMVLAGATNDVTEVSLADNVTSGAVDVLPLPVITAHDTSLDEGRAGKTNVAVAVTLSNPSSRKVTVMAQTVTNTASAGADFLPLKTVVTFLPGETNKTVAVGVVGDTRNEADETFQLSLQSPMNAVLGNASAIVTIVNDDALPVISGANVSRPEGNGGFVKVQFKFQLSAASGRTVAVDYATQAGTAQAGTDYVATNGTLVFPAGKTVATATVLVAGDKVLESNETFLLALSNPVNAELATNAIACTILDNDPLPKVFVDDAGAVEGNAAGTNRVNLRVRLVPPSELPVTVMFSTTNGTAFAGEDYVSTNGLVTFAPGETNQFIRVELIGDSRFEALEYFSLRLGSPMNAVIARSLARASITNDDVGNGMELAADLTGERSAHPPIAPPSLDVQWQAGRLVLGFFAERGVRYAVELSDDLGMARGWHGMPELEVLGAGDWTEVSLPRPLREGAHFFRLRVLSEAQAP